MLKQITNFVKNAVSSVLQRVKNRKYSDQYLKDIVKKSNLKHVAVIADGNRRWAKEHGLSPLEGHRKGFLEVAPQLCDDLWKLGVHTVTIWGFSTGNWDREAEEIDNLMLCLEEMIQNFLNHSQKFECRIIHLGRKDRLSASLLYAIERAENLTKNFSKHSINIGIDYSGRDEICRAIKTLAAQGINFNFLEEEDISKNLDTVMLEYPHPDLIIRSSGEQRLSGFMLWQSIYSELHFPSKYFPELEVDILQKAILDFGKRKRTFSR